MLHRHLSHERLTLAALDDIIEHGTLVSRSPGKWPVRDWLTVARRRSGARQV
jgi:hypothetical protein